MKIMSSFHNKILKGILKLSFVSPLPPLYFLLGELPVEAALHLDKFVQTFWNVWTNPTTKIWSIQVSSHDGRLLLPDMDFSRQAALPDV